MRAVRVAVLCGVVGVILGARVESVPLLRFGEGPLGFGASHQCLHASDDGSYAGPSPRDDAPAVPVDLRRAFPGGFRLFAERTTAYIHADGNITLGLSSPPAWPPEIPRPGNAHIAPWWADVDLRGGGQPWSNAVCHHIERGRFAVTWYRVHAADAPSNAVNSFQLILSETPYCSGAWPSVEFRFEQCDAMNLATAQPFVSGFDAGDLRHWVRVPLPDARSLCAGSNVPGGAPGLWRFQAREGVYDHIGCASSGVACEVPGALGRCASGRSECDSTSVRCAPINAAGPPRCDGHDNDCDGVLDDDDALCATGETCRRGRCVPRCGPARLCPAPLRCDPRGACVTPDCATVRCDAGRVCREGRCVEPCDGVRCPLDALCVGGRCVPACDTVDCRATEVCEIDPDGAPRCVVACPCRACEGPERVCAADGRCIERGCVDVTCPSGERCVRGECVDRCAPGAGGPRCAPEERCVRGECVAVTVGETAAQGPPDGGVAAARTPTAQDGCACHGARAQTCRQSWGGLAALALILRRRRRTPRAA